MKMVIKKFLKYKILIILYEIIIDISIVYLLIIDNEIKDMNRKYIKYNKGFVGQNKLIIFLYVNGMYVILKN